MVILSLYKAITGLSARPLTCLLHQREKAGKERPDRLNERYGIAGTARPERKLVWLHAASVGEAQSAMIIISRLLAAHKDLNILVTTGTIGSADFMAQKLPPRAIHQFYPLDHPAWVARFLDYWQPDCVLWMESELWPNMLLSLQARRIPAVLLNARLSKKSAQRWRLFKSLAASILSTFTLILAQTHDDAEAYSSLGHKAVHVTGNLKYSADPLATDDEDLKALLSTTKGRPLWVYASTHKGEEALACAVHRQLQETFPDLLSIIVPRHPDRGAEVAALCQDAGFTITSRGQDKKLPDKKTAIYIADTIGELGLFYRLAPIAVIGRSFSDDGGGGHNPIEAAQLGAAVLSGPDIQYQRELFDDMMQADAVEIVPNPEVLADAIQHLLTDENALQALQLRGQAFVTEKNRVIETVENHISPLIEKAIYTHANSSVLVSQSA